MSLNNAMAWLGWGLAVVFAVGHLMFPERGLLAPVVLFAAGAATLHVNGFVSSLEARTRNAFELGRAYEQGEVRSLRR